MATSDIGSHLRIRKVGRIIFKAPAKFDRRESRLRFRQDELVGFATVLLLFCGIAYLLGLLIGGQTLP